MSQTLIVTGASRGIGRATALLAGQRGYKVAVNYVSNAAAAEEVVGAIAKAGGTAIAVQGDMGQEADILRLFETTDAKLGRLSALVINAGVSGRIGRLEAMSTAQLRRTFDTNVLGATLCAREGVKRMARKNGGTGGSIVCVSSMAAKLGGAGEWIDYATSKGAVDTLTIGLAREVAADGIRVNGVRPGLIETEFHATAGAPERVAKGAPNVPMQRSGRAEEVATAILWLLSEEASYCTGTIVDVAGGR